MKNQLKYIQWLEENKQVTRAEAQAIWDQMEADPDATGLEYDRKHGHLRFEADEEDYIDVFNQRGISKGCHLSRGKRKPKQEDVEAADREAAANHQKLGSAYFSDILGKGAASHTDLMTGSGGMFSGP
eukprot:3605932-Lingulodinium_polyedra.AAC.1